ncbi:glycosyltransferase [Nitrospirillum sp. BR 11828]|uniref:glycosyltransferase n=1 Tax=Nitrospirillum sp. BR 11828 TaxID=3104325 RepID=UPI002ACACCD1|nr:glycosyltransferase [Nitrospirillum sp. BR 11828]MDZ5647925.1 glycosyltransferase [Nitrospirillum sp. BR 11828]
MAGRRHRCADRLGPRPHRRSRLPRGEGVPKSLLEAAACGRAIVATDVPGSREVAVEGRNALLAPPRDPAALAATLSRLAQDPALRRRLSLGSRAVVDPEFGEAEVGRRMRDLYLGLVAPIPAFSPGDA